MAHHEQQLVLGDGYLKPVDARLESWSALQFTDSPVRLNDPRPSQALRCHVVAAKRLEMRRGTWRGHQRGRLPFSAWAAEWWDTWTADDPSPTTLAATERWLRLHVRPWFADRPIDKITPADVRRWQAQLARNVGRQRSPTAARWRAASSTTPWTKAPSTPTQSRRSRRSRAGSIPSRSSSPRPSDGPSPPRRPGRLLAGLLPLFW